MIAVPIIMISSLIMNLGGRFIGLKECAVNVPVVVSFVGERSLDY